MPLFIDQPAKTLAYATLGFLARVVVSTNFKEPIRQRVEVTTPISNWKRAYEAVHLLNTGLDPYSGNLFHEYPISLQFYKILVSYFNVDLAFAVTDVVIAILLQHSVFNQLLMTNHSKDEASSRSMKVLITYLLSPLTIMSCAGSSTSIFTNFLIAVISFVTPIKPFRAFTCVLCAFLACNNIHYTTLILPIFLSLEYCSTPRRQANKKDQNPLPEPYYKHHDFYSSLSTSAIICLTTLVTLLLTSYFLMGGSWSFIKATYLFLLKIEDLTPNIGMFWYFFTEIFEHFLDFFTWIVQINAFIHAIPLSIHLRDDPFFALYIMIITSTIFQPYPSLSNIGLITSLLPQWTELFPHLKRGLVVCCTGVACMSLWPVFWHLWIVMGTANANFYFGATLAFGVGLVFFLVDLLDAHVSLTARIRFDKLKGDSSSQ